MRHISIFQIFLWLSWEGTFSLVTGVDSTETEDGLAETKPCYTVEGRVEPGLVFKGSPFNWRAQTRILINFGQHVGLVDPGGRFAIHCVPSGSHVVEVANADAIFEPLRVDITSKGKIRARRLNYVQPSLVVPVAYPIVFTVKSKARYFRQREQWRMMDFLLSPMVLMMLMSLFIIVVLPKLVNLSDPEIQREMQQQQANLPRYEIPDLSDMMANWMVGKKSKKKKA